MCGGIGYGKILLFARRNGLGQTGFLLLHFFSVSLVGGSGVLADPATIDEEPRKAWLPYFCRSGQREASLEEFALEAEGWLRVLAVVSFPQLTGEMLEEVVR